MEKMTLQLFAFFMALFMIVVFTACHDDPDKPDKPDAGIYNPSKKISKIYIQYDGELKQLSERWSWDKDKLTKIEYYYDDEYSSSVSFVYDKNRVVEMRHDDGDYVKITYNKSHYDKMSYYSMDENGAIVLTVNFEYTGNQIAKIIMAEKDDTDNYYKKKKQNLLAMFLPKNIVDMQRNRPVSSSNAKTVYTYYTTYEYSYDKQNVTEIRMSYSSDEPDYHSYPETNSYETYDNKNNPLYNSFVDFACPYSKNNPIKYSERGKIYSYDAEGFLTIKDRLVEHSTSYIYDGDYPKEARTRITNIKPVEHIVFDRTETLFYEYIK